MIKKLFSLLLVAGAIAPSLSFAVPAGSSQASSVEASFAKNDVGTADTALMQTANNDTDINKVGLVCVFPIDSDATVVAAPLQCNVGDEIAFDVSLLLSDEDAQNIVDESGSAITTYSLVSCFGGNDVTVGLYPYRLSDDQINSFIKSMGLDPSQHVCFTSFSGKDAQALITAKSDPKAILYAWGPPYLPVAQNVGEEDLHFTGTVSIQAHSVQDGTKEEGWLWWEHKVPTFKQVPASTKTINVTLPVVVSAAASTSSSARSTQ